MDNQLLDSIREIIKEETSEIKEDIAVLKGNDKRLLKLEDEFISHTHKIVIETGKAEVKAG